MEDQSDSRDRSFRESLNSFSQTTSSPVDPLGQLSSAPIASVTDRPTTNRHDPLSSFRELVWGFGLNPSVTVEGVSIGASLKGLYDINSGDWGIQYCTPGLTDLTAGIGATLLEVSLQSGSLPKVPLAVTLGLKAYARMGIGLVPQVSIGANLQAPSRQQISQASSDAESDSHVEKEISILVGISAGVGVSIGDCYTVNISEVSRQISAMLSTQEHSKNNE